MGDSVSLQKVGHWHEQIVDWMLQNPHRTLLDLAAEFEKTPGWIYSVTNTDIFREYRAKRFAAHQEQVSRSVIERTQKLADLSLEVMHDRIERERETIPLAIVKDSAELTLKACGFGVGLGGNNKSEGATVNVNIGGGVAPDVLAEARADLRKLHEANSTSEEEVEDAEVVVVEEEKEEPAPQQGSPVQLQLPLFGE